MAYHEADAGAAVSLRPEQRYDDGQVSGRGNHKHYAVGHDEGHGRIREFWKRGTRGVFQISECERASKMIIASKERNGF